MRLQSQAADIEISAAFRAFATTAGAAVFILQRICGPSASFSTLSIDERAVDGALDLVDGRPEAAAIMSGSSSVNGLAA